MNNPRVFLLKKELQTKVEYNENPVNCLDLT